MAGSAHDALDGVTRTPRLPDHRATVALLNAAAIGRISATRPDVVLSGHIVTGPAALVAKRFLSIPVIQYVYGSELARSSLARRVMSAASASIAISSSTRERSVALGAPAARLHVIPPGVDQPASPRGRDQDAARHSPPIVITVARLSDRYKGFDVMIRALPLVRARVPAMRWVVVGEGPLRGELEAMTVSYGVADCVTFTGALCDRDRDEWLERASVFAMPSRELPGGQGGEGFGLVYLEAGTHGLPSVAGNVGGSTDAVIDGATGVTVDPTDHVAVADAIADLLLEPARSELLGAGAREHAARLSWAHMARAVDELIERVVAEAALKPRR